jgi:Mg-chelatase subunit ChlD
MRYLEFATGIQDQTAERLVVCLDVSPSMEDTDWPPSRLRAAKKATEALIERKRLIAPNDEVGVIIYSKEAEVLAAPREVGQHAAELVKAVRRAKTGSATNITSALEKAKPLLPRPIPQKGFWGRLLSPAEPPPTPRVLRVILLTDGEHNSGPSPTYIAQRLKDVGVCIDCVGIGGDPSAVDEKLLKKIASTHKDGVTPRYTFIGDQGALIEKFEQLAGRITR